MALPGFSVGFFSGFGLGVVLTLGLIKPIAMILRSIQPVHPNVDPKPKSIEVKVPTGIKPDEDDLDDD